MPYEGLADDVTQCARVDHPLQAWKIKRADESASTFNETNSRKLVITVVTIQGRIADYETSNRI